MTLAYHAISKILAISNTIEKVFIYSTACNRGLSLVISKIVNWKGLDVIYEDEISEKEDENGSMLAKIAAHHMRGSSEYANTFDCIILSSNMHPIDQAALIGALKKGNVINVLGHTLNFSH